RYGCSIDTFHDQDTITHLLPCPAINFLGRKSRIDSQAEDGHHNPVMRWEALVQDLRELVPDLNVGCIAFQYPVINRPGLLAHTPRDNFDLDAITLYVSTCGHEETASRDHPNGIGLAPVIQPLPFRRLPLLDPAFRESSIHEDL